MPEMLTSFSGLQAIANAGEMARAAAVAAKAASDSAREQVKPLFGSCSQDMN